MFNECKPKNIRTVGIIGNFSRKGCCQEMSNFSYHNHGRKIEEILTPCPSVKKKKEKNDQDLINDQSLRKRQLVW